MTASTIYLAMDSPQTEHMDKGKARPETRQNSQCRSASPNRNELDIDQKQHSPPIPYNRDMNERSACQIFVLC